MGHVILVRSSSHHEKISLHVGLSASTWDTMVNHHRWLLSQPCCHAHALLSHHPTHPLSHPNWSCGCIGTIATLTTLRVVTFGLCVAAARLTCGLCQVRHSVVCTVTARCTAVCSSDLAVSTWRTSARSVRTFAGRAHCTRQQHQEKAVSKTSPAVIGHAATCGQPPQAVVVSTMLPCTCFAYTPVVSSQPELWSLAPYQHSPHADLSPLGTLPEEEHRAHAVLSASGTRSGSVAVAQLVQSPREPPVEYWLPVHWVQSLPP